MQKTPSKITTSTSKCALACVSQSHAKQALYCHREDPAVGWWPQVAQGWFEGKVTITLNRKKVQRIGVAWPGEKEALEILYFSLAVPEVGL